MASAVDYVDAGLAKMAKKVDTLVAAQEVKKQLNNDDAWTGCGSDAHISKEAFENVIIYGRPRDTPATCQGTFDYSAKFCVSDHWVDNHAPRDWRELDGDGPGLNVFRGPCIADRSCGNHNECESGDYCGYDQSNWFHTQGGNNHTCIKMYPRDTNETFGSPTNLTLRDVESERKRGGLNHLCLHMCINCAILLSVCILVRAGAGCMHSNSRGP